VIQIFNNIADGMGAVLAFVYSLVPNYGLAIIGLTVIVRLVLFPMTAKQARSMQKMQQIQPEIKKLQARYKDNRQQLNEEIMKFYKENKVNPMAGCLPLVLQMPVFFALFRVLREPLKHIPHDSKLFRAFCENLDASKCGKTAGYPKGLSFLGMNLSKAASDIHGSFTTALPYFLLIALVVVTGYLQFKQTQSRQTNAQANPQAAMMGKIFPAFFAFISYRLPAGVVLYFLVSNGWQIGQQALIFRTAPDPVVGGAAGGAVPASGSAPRPSPKSGDGNPKPRRRPPSRRRRGGSSGPWARPGRPVRVGASRVGTETPRRNRRRNHRRPAAPDRPGTGDGPGPTVGFAAPAEEATAIEVRTTVEWIVTTGKTVAEAVEAALDELGVDEADIEYEVMEESKRGFLSRLGGGSPARIKARVKPLSREKPDRRRRSGGRERDRKAGGEGGERPRGPGPIARPPTGLPVRDRPVTDRPVTDRVGADRPRPTIRRPPL